MTHVSSGLALVLAGCAAHAPPPPPRPAPPVAAVKPGLLDSSMAVENDVMHIRAAGKAVPLPNVPIAETIGLPMVGNADIDIDLHVPMLDGHPDFRGATGAAKFRCEPCTLGDDKTKLKPHMKDARSSGFAGDGISFGHITFDRIDVELAFDRGHADITRWVIDSPDVTIEMAAHLELAQELAHSTITGCLRFSTTPALAERDPKTTAAIATTGAPLAPDGLFNIKLAGPLNDMKRLGMVCGNDAP